MTAEQWCRVIDVSLNGFFNLTQPLVMPMIRALGADRQHPAVSLGSTMAIDRFLPVEAG